MDNIKKMDILNALACLKAMCASYDTCVNCPAYIKSRCEIKYADPEDYDLNITDDYVWRAFEND